MHEHRFCEGCGDGRLDLVEAYAAEAAAGDVEVAVWRCRGCGGLAEEVGPAPAIDPEPVISTRVA